MDKREPKRPEKGVFDAMAAALGLALGALASAVIAVLVILIMMLTACTSTQYVPVETVRTEYQDKVKEIHTTDSVIDTRFVYVKGDTVIDWRDRVKWRDRYIHDSIFIENNDTIRVPYPVERELSRWEQTKMDFGGMALGGVVIAVCFAVVWLIKRFKR